MAHSTKHHVRPSPIAMAYAQSLLELASEQKQAEAVAAELAAIRKIIEENPAVREVLANPAIGVEERAQMLDRTFRNNVSPLVFNLLGVMNQHGRLGLIEQASAAYDDLLLKQLGKVDVDLIVARKLEPDQVETARHKITASLGRDAVLHEYVDDKIVGGMVIRVGDKLIDASVKAQLDAMKQQLLSAAPK